MSEWTMKPPEKYCHACGAPIQPDAVHCSHCGARQPVDVLDALVALDQVVASTIEEWDNEAKSRTTAGWLAIFLGGIGAHWFYLERNWRGAMYMLFVWTLVPILLGIIDGMRFLSWSDRRFDRMFNR
jgi:TM2 domain-containing membrane protein YozV